MHRGPNKAREFVAAKRNESPLRRWLSNGLLGLGAIVLFAGLLWFLYMAEGGDTETLLVKLGEHWLVAIVGSACVAGGAAGGAAARHRHGAS